MFSRVLRERRRETATRILSNANSNFVKAVFLKAFKSNFGS